MNDKHLDHTVQIVLDFFFFINMFNYFHYQLLLIGFVIKSLLYRYMVTAYTVVYHIIYYEISYDV